MHLDSKPCPLDTQLFGLPVSSSFSDQRVAGPSCIEKRSKNRLAANPHERIEPDLVCCVLSACRNRIVVELQGFALRIRLDEDDTPNTGGDNMLGAIVTGNVVQ